MNHLVEQSPLGILVVLALAPVLLAMLYAKLPHRLPDTGVMLTGNPLFENADPDAVTPSVSAPLIHMIRTRKPEEMRGVALGLRFLPITETATLLSHCARSDDVELKLYAQTVMADGQDKLQSSFLNLQHLVQKDSPANTASCIGAGLNLLDSPLTPESERPSILKRLEADATQVVTGTETHPRLVYDAARAFIRLQRLPEVEKLMDRLPEGSPLYGKLDLLKTHLASVIAAQKAFVPVQESGPSSDYEIR